MKALKYYKFINESREYKTLSEQEAMDYCISNCSYWINSQIQVEKWKVTLYRGGKNIQDISYTNPQLEEVERTSKYGNSTDKIIKLLNKFQQQTNKIFQNRKKSIFYTSNKDLAEFHSDTRNPKICAAILPDKAKISYLPKDFNLHETVTKIREIVEDLQAIVNIYSTGFDTWDWLEEGFCKWMVGKYSDFKFSKSFKSSKEKEEELWKLVEKLSKEIENINPSEIYSKESNTTGRDEYWSESEVILIPLDIYYEFRVNLLEYMKTKKI